MLLFWLICMLAESHGANLAPIQALGAGEAAAVGQDSERPGEKKDVSNCSRTKTTSLFIKD